VAPGGLPLWDPAAAMSIVRFGVPAAVSGLTSTLQRNVTLLVLGGSARPEQVGLYWRAYQLGVEYQYKISTVMYYVAKPVLTRAARIEDLREIRTRLARLNTALIFPLLALLIVLAPDVVPWIFGPDWAGAVEPTRVLAVGGMFMIPLAAISPPLMAIGRPGALAIFNVVFMVAMGVAAWFTAPLGITAVAVGTAICTLLLLLGGQFFLLRRLVGVPMRDSLGESVPALVCSAVLVLATLPLADLLRASLEPLPLTMLIGSSGLAVYAAGLRIVSPPAWRDLRTLFVRVLGARRFLPRVRHTPQRA
jgi:O-antigen/teichoic acid export membrane protein